MAIPATRPFGLGVTRANKPIEEQKWSDWKPTMGLQP